jgi:hypothetical protein
MGQLQAEQVTSLQHQSGERSSNCCMPEVICNVMGLVSGPPDCTHLLAIPWHHALAHLQRPRRCQGQRCSTPRRLARDIAICDMQAHASYIHTASVASGVTSRGAGPVPPVVTTSEQPSLSHSSFSVSSISGRSSGMTRYTASQLQESWRRVSLHLQNAPELPLRAAVGGRKPTGT